MRRLLVFLVVLLAGCDTYHFVAGLWKEDSRDPLGAIKHYERFLDSKPKDPRACELRLRAASLHTRVFGRCEDARWHYETAARDFPHMPACARLAKAGLLDCPDFFPFEPGRTWVYVDSASGGLAARLSWEARPSSAPASGVIQEALYAGNRLIRENVERYEKGEWAVWRLERGKLQPLLRYPYSEGQSWTAIREKKKIEYLVVSSSAAVETRAGAFSGCLKLRERDPSFKDAWRYDYYCPGVGRVKTTIGGPGYENPNMELLRFGRIN